MSSEAALGLEENLSSRCHASLGSGLVVIAMMSSSLEVELCERMFRVFCRLKRKFLIDFPRDDLGGLEEGTPFEPGGEKGVRSRPESLRERASASARVRLRELFPMPAEGMGERSREVCVRRDGVAMPRAGARGLGPPERKLRCRLWYLGHPRETGERKRKEREGGG